MVTSICSSRCVTHCFALFVQNDRANQQQGYEPWMVSLVRMKQEIDFVGWWKTTLWAQESKEGRCPVNAAEPPSHLGEGETGCKVAFPSASVVVRGLVC